MNQISETGHAMNMINFQSLLTFIDSLGDLYNPSRECIKRESLQTLLDNTQESFNSLYITQSNYTLAVDDRIAAFEPLSKLVTRVFNSLKASDSSVETDESVRTIVRKIQGKRATPLVSSEHTDSESTEVKEIKHKSTSQMSYNSRLENFEWFIIFLSKIPEYNPNEEDLKIESLKTLHSDLKAKNNLVMTAHSKMETERTQRNKMLYQPLTGIVDISIDIKSYIKSLFGASSHQYKQISKLHFKARL